jgi:hypothetical protein
MDKVKEFLRLAIKYRFWIVVGVAALLPMIAYFVASGSVKAETEAATSAATSAHNDVKKYQSGLVPSPEFKTEADKRTEVLKTDIDQAWRLLYNRQAPLLTWPEEVADMFQTWGKRWPESYDDAAIRNVVNDYVQLYPDQVDATYAAFRPFNYEDGTGIVVAPVKEALLRPAGFSLETPPTLGKVWGAQQKLWIQRTVLDVIDQVNRDTKDWDNAPIKEITGLEVANMLSQDQKSIAKAEVIEPAPEIVKPGSATAAAPPPTAPSGPLGSESSGMMSSDMMSSNPMGGLQGKAGEPEVVYIFKKSSESQPFEVIPVFVSVLIDQRRVLDLIAAFEASPMEIQVVDFELNRPTKRVQKPEKGEVNPSFMYGGMGSGIAGMRMTSDMLGGYGGSMMGASSDMMGSMGMMTSDMLGGYGGMGAAPAPKRVGTDIKTEQLKKLEEKKKKAAEKDDPKKAGARGSYADPYYDVVEVKIYGHARFYNPPPAETPAEPSAEPASPGDTPVTLPAEGSDVKPIEGPDAKPADPAAPAAAEAPKADAMPPAEGSDVKPIEGPDAKPADPAAPAAAEAPKADAMPPAEGGAPAPPPAEGGAPAPPPAAPGI